MVKFTWLSPSQALHFHCKCKHRDMILKIGGHYKKRCIENKTKLMNTRVRRGSSFLDFRGQRRSSFLLETLGYPANICWSSRHFLKTSSTRLQRDSFRLPRRLGRRKIVTLKTSWKRLKDMFWRRLEDVPWRRLQDVLEKNKMFAWDICI